MSGITMFLARIAIQIAQPEKSSPTFILAILFPMTIIASGVFSVDKKYMLL